MTRINPYETDTINLEHQATDCEIAMMVTKRIMVLIKMMTMMQLIVLANNYVRLLVN